MDTILYEVHYNLYVNLTNKCPCVCTFCLRQTRDHMENSGSLWLSHTPSLEEVLGEFGKFDMSKYEEVVFGLGNLIHKKEVPPLLKGLAVTVSISLNTPDAKEYEKLVR